MGDDGLVQEPVWTMRDGTVIPMSEMTESHLQNCIKLFSKDVGANSLRLAKLIEEAQRRGYELWLI
jgi:hypothetical protein